MTEQGVPIEGSTFHIEHDRYFMTSADGSKHEFPSKQAYEAAVALKTYNGSAVPNEFFER